MVAAVAAALCTMPLRKLHVDGVRSWQTVEGKNARAVRSTVVAVGAICTEISGCAGRSRCRSRGVTTAQCCTSSPLQDTCWIDESQ
jgi:hypothetical protein